MATTKTNQETAIARSAEWNRPLKWLCLSSIGERPFNCPYEGCTRSFTTSNIRKVHMRTHTGERPYVCEIEGCNRSFASATNYKNHSRIHTGGKLYWCLLDSKHLQILIEKLTQFCLFAPILGPEKFLFAHVKNVVPWMLDFIRCINSTIFLKFKISGTYFNAAPSPL